MILVKSIENLSPAIPVDLVEKTALAALAAQSAPPESELTIVLSNDVQLRDLNLRWMGINAPTDVLSFPSDENDPETGFRYLGDIIISVETAARQAARAGHTVQAEVQLLTIHGILHLLGYDHAEEKEKAEMWAAQAEILEKLGLGYIQVRDE